MKEAAKSKARKVFHIVQWIVFIYAIIFLAGGVFKAFTYSGYYDEPAKTMLTEHSGDQQFLWHMVSEMSGALQADLVMFSGNSEVGKLTVGQNGTLTITPTVMTGKAKVLLLNRENKIVYSEEPARSGQAVSVTPGTYRAVIVGRWFTGNILFEMPDPPTVESNVTVLSGPSPYLRESLHASGTKSEEAAEASVIYPEPADETGRFIAADKGLDVAFAHNMYEGRDGMSLEEQVAALVQGAPEEYGQPDYIVAVSDDLGMETLPFDYQARLLEWKDAGKLPEYTVEGKPRYFVPDDLAKALWEPETNH